ncbi:MAG: hypothetical protein N4A33_04875 [Bacteriovoracaceae bacterium]|jgi:hypothetical protein|nr:hypothetical protein [Bacteriovoracaceae bacterium]
MKKDDLNIKIVKEVSAKKRSRVSIFLLSILGVILKPLSALGLVGGGSTSTGSMGGPAPMVGPSPIGTGPLAPPGTSS